MILCKLRLTVWAASIASAALPGIPRDIGTALKAVRGGEKVADAAKAVDKAGCILPYKRGSSQME